MTRSSARHRRRPAAGQNSVHDPQFQDPRAKSFPGDGEGGERIAKRIARAGLASRREAERWIAEGRVALAGKPVTTPATLVSLEDLVTVDGKPLPDQPATRLWRYNKPAGLVTTHRDPQGRPTVFAALPGDLPRVVSVGRLDLTSEGLLLLTTDGALARHLELPQTGWVRRYRVRVNGRVEAEKLVQLADGVTISGVRYGPIEAALDRQQGANAWLTVALSEGKNREVRKVMEHLGYPVSRLIRIAYGPFQLGTLDPGAVAPVSLKVMHEQIGDFFGAGTKASGNSAERAGRKRRADPRQEPTD